MSARSDKLHQRRKNTDSLRRRAPTLEPKKRILLVCEGEVTEVDYFEHLRSKTKSSNLDIEVCGKECGSSPTSVVSFALERSRQEGPYDCGGYDKVFCVFDRDDHQDFEKAKGQILSARKSNSAFKGGSIDDVWSDPCFEVWLTMHFSNSRAPYVASNGLTIGQSVSRNLRKYSPFGNFEKKLDAAQLSALDANFANAMKNAANAYDDYEKTGEPNPSTKIFLLIKEILEEAVD